jgi:hypothetical protein
MTGMHPENNKLARWQSVKVVSAGEIVDIMPLEDSSEIKYVCVKMADDNKSTARWIDVGDRHPFKNPDKLPKLGDFYVEYEDNYVSWSPRQAFLTGYVRQ